MTNVGCARSRNVSVSVGEHLDATVLGDENRVKVYVPGIICAPNPLSPPRHTRTLLYMTRLGRTTHPLCIPGRQISG